ncbi:MAG: choice-of-anchor J domain-containing protein, partial [Bacteroidales bacterium]|nr:choice-of-anchor J domain-containing protein [Bacteroidales bacterium]
MTKRIYLTMLALLLAFSGLYAQNPEVKIGNVTSGPGQILVPVEMLNFTQNVNSFTFRITANSNLLTFDGLANVTGFNSVIANQSGNTLNIGYFDLTGYQPNGKVFDLKFNYTAAANTNLTFQVELCEVTAGIVNVGNITYTNGVITTTQPVPDPVVKIADVTTAPGAVNVGVEMLNFTQNVNSIQFKINVPSNLLQFIELTNINPAMIGAPELNLTGNLLSIGWNNVTGFIPDGHVFNLRLNYVGGFNTDITWSTGNEVTYSGTVVSNISYIKGSVNQLPAVGTVTVGSTASVTNSTVSLPVSFSGAGFTNVSAFTLFISYDAAKLVYQGTSNLISAAIEVNHVGNQINIAWQGAAADFSNLTALHLDFIYTGIAPAQVTFLPGCEVNNVNTTPLATNYVNGLVSPLESTSSLKISDVLALTGQLVDVPIIATNLDEVGAFDIVVNYDNTKLTLIEIDLTQLSGWEVNQAAGQITFGWNLAGGATVTNGELINLEFLYLGGGLTPVTFGANTAVTGVNALPMIVNFLNGSVGLGQSNSQVVIGSITSCAGNTAIVPITFNQIGDVTSFTLPIGFSAANLTFVELASVNPLLEGLIVNAGADFINIGWNNTIPQNLDGKLFDLVFSHLGLNSPIVFNPGAEVTGPGAVVLPVSFIDGLVNCNIEYRTLTLDITGNGDVEVKNGDLVLSPDENTANEFTVFYGTELTLTATGDEGWEFSAWTGSVANTTTASTTINMINNFGVTAIFTMIDYTLTLNVNPEAGGTVTGAGVYNYGNTVTATAVPATGYAFANWTDAGGTVVSSASVYAFSMPASDLTLTANFTLIDYTLTLVANPVAGGTVTGGGVFNYGNTVTATAVPATGYAFANWTNAGGTVVSSASVYAFTMPANNLTLTANFTLVDYTLTLVANPVAGGSLTGGGVYNFGNAVTATAVPATGYAFANWTDAGGTVVSTAAAYAFTMPANNLTLTANFTLIDYTLTLVANPVAGGTVTGAGVYNYGAVVPVNAVAAAGYEFVNWTNLNGDVVSTVPANNITITGNLTLIANFNLAYVATFPFFEDYEGATFPPLGWGIYDVDANANVRTWVSSIAQNHTTGGSKSAFHNYGPSTQTEDGWMVTPKIPLPAGIEIKLSFWSYNGFVSYYGKNSVLISTAGNTPASGDFVEVWTTPSVTSPWMETVVDLSAYAGQNIFIAFRYQGSDAHTWFVDDVLVDEPVYAPLIAVAPASLTETLGVGETSVQQVTVTNNGTADLDFELVVNTSVRAPKVDSKEDYQRLLDRIALYNANGDVESPAYIETKVLPAPTDAITCPAGSLISQPAVNFATAYNSDQGGNFASYQSFTGGGTISGLRFWTISAFFNGTAWGPCTGIDPRPFNIGFYADNAGQPGAQIALYTNIQLTRTATGDMFAGTYPIYEYTATFPNVFVAQGWFSIQSMTGTAVNCWNLTLNQPGGAGVCMQLNTSTNAWTTQTAPLGFCLIEGSSGAANDVGVQAIVSPVSAPNLGNETVTITVRNYGTASQSNIPVSFTLDGGAAVTGVVPGPLAGGASVNYTFAGTVNLSTVGQTYVINACTALAGDELAANNCVSASITNVAPSYCAATTSPGDDEYISNVLFGSINNSSGWQGGVANYTALNTEIAAGNSEALTVSVTNFYASNKVTAWVDWNMDYTFGIGNAEEFILTNVGGTGASFTGNIMVPAGTPAGDYRMRIRLTYSIDPLPCGAASWGEVEDYTVRVTGDTPPPTEWLSASPLMGTVAPGETVTIDVAFSAEDVAVGTYQGSLVFTSNDGTNPTVTVPVTLEVTGPTDPIIVVEPASLAETLEQDMMSTQIVTVSNIGGAALNYELVVNSTATAPTQVNFDLPVGGDRANPLASDIIASAVVPSQNNVLMRSSFSEGFDDITTLPGAGWALINKSAPVGTTSWFQASATAPFPAHSGAATSYIGANYNNTAGTGTISNWLLTPETSLVNGNTISFWTRVPAASSWPDRLEVRMSTNGASQNVGTSATDVGDFTTLMLSVNAGLTVGGYPEVWTQFTATISGLAAPTTGRIAFRYFVTGGGPSGNNSNYIGIDSFEYTGSTVTPDEWLSASPLSGVIAPGETAEIEVMFDATGLAVGSYTGSLVFTSNDPVTPVVTVPVTLEVEPSTICYPVPRNLASAVNGQNVTLTWQEPDLGGGGGTTEDFFEGFEAGVLPTGWVTYDVDGDGYIWNNSAIEFSVFDAHTGLYCMTSASYRNDVGALTPNNWLVTPPIAVTATSELKFWVDAQDPSWSQEQYYVKVSTTGNAVANFTTTLHSAISPANWTEVVLNLGAYAGQTIDIAFQHANVTDMFFIKIDDVTVTNTATKAAYTAPVAVVHNNEIFFRTSGMTQGEIDEKLNPTFVYVSGDNAETTTIGGEAHIIPSGIKHMSGSRNRTLLHDNGPFINSPGTGPNGTDQSILQNVTLGMNTLGAGIQFASGNRMADDIVVDETWTVETITVYTYQTGSPTTSTITGGYVQVWDGDPTAGG